MNDNVSKEVLLNAISKMSVMELVELVEALEKKFNVTASAFMSPSLSSVNSSSVENKTDVVEKTEFKVVLQKYGTDKINVIKVIRSILKLGLKESKDLVESVPVMIKEKLTKSEAESLKKEIEDAGAVVSID